MPTDGIAEHTHPAAMRAVKSSGLEFWRYKVYGWIQASVSVLFEIPILIKASSDSAVGNEGTESRGPPVARTSWKMLSRICCVSLPRIFKASSRDLCSEEMEAVMSPSLRGIWPSPLKPFWFFSGTQSLLKLGKIVCFVQETMCIPQRFSKCSDALLRALFFSVQFLV